MVWYYSILEIWGHYYRLAFMKYWFFPLVALAFLAAVPRLVRLFITWR